MNILCIDTSTSTLFIGLSTPNKTITKINEHPNIHNEILLPSIESLLREASTDSREIDILSMISGPGSFTGLRVGSCLLKTWSYVTSSKIMAFTAFEWLSFFCRQFKTNRAIDNKGIKIFAIDGRNRRLFLQIFDGENPITSIFNIATVDLQRENFQKLMKKKLLENQLKETILQKVDFTRIYTWQFSSQINQILQCHNINIHSHSCDVSSYLTLIKEKRDDRRYEIDAMSFEPFYGNELH